MPGLFVPSRLRGEKENLNHSQTKDFWRDFRPSWQDHEMDSAIFCPSPFAAAGVPFNGFALGATPQFRHINAVSHEIFPQAFPSGDRGKLIVTLGPPIVAR